MNKHNCPICGNSQSIFALCEVNGFSVYGCKSCSAEHVFPMPVSEKLKAYYDREEWFEGNEVGGYHNYDQQTIWSVEAIKPILEEFEDLKGLSILDVGCGYGTHLEIAENLGWKCFGVEVSDHARKIAKQRLAGKACIVEAVEDLIPHEFDLVLMLDVIEHLPAPYTLFYNLFSIGAITPKTRIVISTPNAGSEEARQNPANWTYRHPPSHLVYYTSESLKFLLNKLHFADVNVKGVHLLQAGQPDPELITNFGGLLVTATGSNFTEFMRERYVPGTWSKIAEYEHLPRYELARSMVTGKTVLDFGCGTGYGSAILSQVAAKVTGLDIDHEAISWANSTHYGARLIFHRCSDLGATLPVGSFDVVTCFEMIEHVDYETQQGTVASISSLLRDDGLLIISTPNPEITKLYGANPYHLREMTLPQFHELLAVHFPHIRIFEQRVHNSITFNELAASQLVYEQSLLQGESSVVPLAYIAFCAKQPIVPVNALVVFDDEVDLIQDVLSREQKLNALRFDVYRLMEENNQFKERFVVESDAVASQAAEIGRLNDAFVAQGQEIVRLNQAAIVKDIAVASQAAEIGRLNDAFVAQGQEIVRLNQAAIVKDIKISEVEAALSWIVLSKWYRLGVAIKARPVTLGGLKTISYLLTVLILPGSVRSKLHSLVAKWRQRKLNQQVGRILAQPVADDKAYIVKQSLPATENLPRIIHVIANLCTGGSSRLVVDLVEGTGQYYGHSVVTSYIPIPPAYVGMDVVEFRFLANEQSFVEYFTQVKPALIHVHYWGDCDESWYAKAFMAAQQLGVPIVENINTPVAPYISSAVKRYVYVSDYVRRMFGKEESNHLTIYPGSDFSLFSRDDNEPWAESCVGMVYRLERDKLNEASILPFIQVVQKRPDTCVLIVGGGSLLEEYKRATTEAGVISNFEFTDYVSYTTLPDYYRRMSVFVVPVWKESFGQVSPFAMNMKIPVCGYDVGGIGEIVGNPDLLAPAEDVDRLADIILRLLDSPEERKAIGAYQHQRAQAHFSVQTMIHAYGEIYQQLTGVPDE